MKILIFSFLFILHSLSWGQELRSPTEVVVRETLSPPVLDGKLDDKCWTDATRVELLLNSGGIPKERTTAFLAYDKANLYIAFKCFESNPNRPKAEIKERDGKVYSEDCIDVFLDVNSGENTYYHFIVNAIGTKYDSIVREGIGNVDNTWDGDWQVKTFREKDSWTLEMALPFKNLKLNAGIWKINLNRENPSINEYSALSPTFGTFHNPRKFAVLKGVVIPFYTNISIGDINPGAFCFGKNIFKANLKNNLNREIKLEAKLDILSQRLSSTVVIKGEENAEISIPYSMAEEGGHCYVFALAYLGEQDEIYSFSSFFKTSFLNVFLNSKIFYADEKLPLRIKLNISDTLLKESSIRMEVRTDKKILLTKELNKLSSDMNICINCHELPIGTFTLSLLLLSKECKIISKYQEAFELIEPF